MKTVFGEIPDNPFRTTANGASASEPLTLEKLRECVARLREIEEKCPFRKMIPIGCEPEKGWLLYLPWSRELADTTLPAFVRLSANIDQAYLFKKVFGVG